MLTLIVLLLTGLGIAYFAIQNTQGVTLTFANYPLTNIPVYLVTLISMLLGIILAWILSIPGILSGLFESRGKDHTITQAHRSIDDLKEHIRSLEVENARLKGTRGEEEIVETDEKMEYRPTLMTRLRQGFR